MSRLRVALCVSVVVAAAAPSGANLILGGKVGELTAPEVTRPLRELPLAYDEPLVSWKADDRENPLAGEADQGRRGTWSRPHVPDPLAPTGVEASRRTPDPELTFDGTGNPAACGGCSPPDTTGDMGPNHYVQMVNATKVAVFTRSGALVAGPVNLGTLWTSGVCTSNAGDPVVAYDPLADRWILSQFAGPSHLCMAVSQGADPTGSYFAYTFDVGSFPDYFKVGVWPSGYMVSANESSYTAYAFDRESMLAGVAATYQKFTGGANFFLGADVDGLRPPAVDEPGIFYTFKDDSFHGGSDRIELYELDVDWITPASSTFSLQATIPVASFGYTPCGFFNFNCIRQSGTPQRVDAVAEWPMTRLAYRNFGTHESLVGTYTVDGATSEEGAAPRWFELRRSGGAWALFQEGTYDPADNHDRFMGSIAMDRAGNIALGYSVSSSAMFPAIRYATRLASDPAGTLGVEATLIDGAGSQTGSNRWGDYSALSIDPASDCVFYFTSEYYPATSATTWKTRIGAFRIPGCDALFLDDFETGSTSRWSAAAP